MMALHIGIPLLVSSCVGSISSFLTAPYTAWFPVVILAVLAIISILSVLYMLGPFIGGITSIRPWVKVKVYELLLSIILIAIFASIATGLCTFNPVGLYSNAGLASAQCSSPAGSTPVDNIYSLALCNLYQFNNDVNAFNNFIFYTMVSFSLEPSFMFGTLTLTPYSYLGSKINPLGTPSFYVAIEAGPLTLSPLTTKANKFEPFIIGAIYLFSLLNQLQLMLLAASPYLFAFFMAIGLIARAFGVTRTFGGAMIAFGLGIGLMYPVLTSLNYGFMDYALEHTTQASLVVPAVSPAAAFTNILASYFSGQPIGTGFTEQFFMRIGLIVIGVTFINILNFVILDAFIADLSQALGERMDFLSLLTNVI
ncbi:MAG: hypothetical protein M1321_00465 [Candidatus Marsarchaeota archaeon]|nr:hypothetical protein [Candidatus Marsarchaeota archaeon]